MKLVLTVKYIAAFVNRVKEGKMAEEAKSFADLKNWLNSLLVTAYAAFAYFLTGLLLDNVVPRIVRTTRTAQDFWIFGVAAMAFCAGAIAMFKVARSPGVCHRLTRILMAMGIVFEALVFIGAIAIWIEAGQYATWVGQYETISLSSGVDIRYWVSATLFAQGIAGNLLAALLTA